MGLFDFKRCEGFVGGGAQRFIDEKFPICPMCGTNAPYWQLQNDLNLKGSRTFFRCDECGCILSASIADLSGIISTKLSTRFKAAGMYSTIRKKAAGSSEITFNMRIEETGNVQTTKIYQGKEMSVEDLQYLAEEFSKDGKQ